MSSCRTTTRIDGPVWTACRFPRAARMTEVPWQRRQLRASAHRRHHARRPRPARPAPRDVTRPRRLEAGRLETHPGHALSLAGIDRPYDPSRRGADRCGADRHIGEPCHLLPRPYHPRQHGVLGASDVTRSGVGSRRLRWDTDTALISQSAYPSPPLGPAEF